MAKIETKKGKIEWLRFGILTVFLILFILGSLINGSTTYKAIIVGFNFISTNLGGLTQILMFLLWVIALYVAISKFGNIRIGGKDSKKETNTFSWYAVIITTMLAGGGVFYATAEPFYHFINLPPHFNGIESATTKAVGYALAQSAFNWGYLVWGATAFCIPLLAYVIYEKGLPNRPSSMLWLISGEKVTNGVLGKAFDIFSLIGVAAGTIGPTGFLGLQIAFALNAVWGIPNTALTQIVVILVASITFVIGAATGLKKGIDLLSRATVYLGVVFAAGILTLGCGMFVFDSYINSLGVFMHNFFVMAFTRVDPTWLGSWTIFYQIWFLAYGPSMAVLALSMSKGRTLREVMIGIGVICPMIAGVWFSIFGGVAIGFEMQNAGILSTVMNTDGLPSVLITLLQQLPHSYIMIPLALILITLFLVTTGSGAAYSMSVQVTNMDVPYAWIRALLAILLGASAAALVLIGGNDAMSAMQNFIVICGLPLIVFYIMLIPSVFKAARLLYQNKQLRVEEGILETEE
ncbi:MULTISPECIES: BCCT family transporter [unclassified Sedimentibacter]|uniref:BCCT family transporter n=1 Tax=unclassified Sedimentibacter TaxID=2649220 RepID=UPI0027DFBADF|nr:BCCT family transporter [Sedimentibacter sp. MB35-C1]WMJ77497.1 BCCT family transporter [Sedimentibacter sp. MB35-C1]